MRSTFLGAIDDRPKSNNTTLARCNGHTFVVVANPVKHRSEGRMDVGSKPTDDKQEL